MLGRSEAEGDHDNTGIDEEADQNAGGDDFHVRNFVLVQVPRSSDTEKFSAVPITIYHENDKIYYLEKKTIEATKIIYTWWLCISKVKAILDA